MTGTLLAGAAWTFVLLAAFRYWQQKDAPKTRKSTKQDYVSREDLDEALEQHRKDLEWEWTEMYEKFNKLHLRLAKRDKRTKTPPNDVEQEELDVQQFGHNHRSALPFRRLGSP